MHSPSILIVRWVDYVKEIADYDNVNDCIINNK
jgi:hypothetical protein